MLVGLGTVTLAAILAFIRSERVLNKAAIGVMYTVFAAYSLTANGVLL